MGEIRQLKSLATADRLERIVAAAKDDAGFWLMVKERAMEMRAMTAELARLGIKESELDQQFPKRLTPTISDLADELMSRIFGRCPPETLVLVKQALLEAARNELNSGLLQSYQPPLKGTGRRNFAARDGTPLDKPK